MRLFTNDVQLLGRGEYESVWQSHIRGKILWQGRGGGGGWRRGKSNFCRRYLWKTRPLWNLHFFELNSIFVNILLNAMRNFNWMQQRVRSKFFLHSIFYHRYILKIYRSINISPFFSHSIASSFFFFSSFSHAS